MSKFYQKYIMTSDLIVEATCKTNDFYCTKQLISPHRHLCVKLNISYVH